MTESNDVQAIEKISAVVGESQIKIILSNQCIKAQTLLVNRLKRQFERQKETSKFISTDNIKLEAEIKNAEQEIKSLMLAHESLKSANVELKKEWHLAKERTQETVERIKIGEKKYEELWEQCKSRYESLGFVQNWLQAKERTEVLTKDTHCLEGETQGLLKEIKAKEDLISALNKKCIIELAEYLIRERPKLMENLTRKSKELKELHDQFEHLKIQNSKASINKDKADFSVVNPKTDTDSQKLNKTKIDNDWLNLNNSNNGINDTLMPKLQLMSIDLDMLSVKLDQIKKCDVVATKTTKQEIPAKVAIDEPGPSQDTAIDNERDEYISYYFNKSVNETHATDETKESKSNNFSTRKLINILEDIKLEKSEAYNLVSKVNMANFQGVHAIAANVNTNNDCLPGSMNEKKQEEARDVEIEEIDITSSNAENILLPPSGFLDQIRNSQEKKKRVSFEVPVTMEETAAEPTENILENEIEEDNAANVTINSALEVSSVSDESFTKIKDMILKKHNLDLSPQFVYAKNTVLLKNEETVKSNYFKLTGEEIEPSTSKTCFEQEKAKITEIMEAVDNEIDCEMQIQSNNNETKVQSVEMKVDEDGISCVEVNQGHNIGKQVTGLLFNHGPQGIPDSLDISISTTGYEEGDADFPQYSSLLLSPKADLPIPASAENTDIISQEVPNFLSGLRKTGLSFFGKLPETASNSTEAGAPSGGNFNFTFGTDDKTKRGGIFNMFQ